MKRNKKALIAAGLIAGAAALTGCSANTTPVATPTPQAAQKETAQPQTATNSPGAQAEASASPEAGGEESPVPLSLTVEGEDAPSGAMLEHDVLLLPLIPVGEALGYKVTEEEVEEETQVRRSIALEKDESRITVSWVSSDNTARQITWQKDGLLVPVDTRLTTFEDVVYVPAAFFEEACKVSVSRTQDGVKVTAKEPADTPPAAEQDAQENMEEDGQNG